jgi:hypothetical protein
VGRKSTKDVKEWLLQKKRETLRTKEVEEQQRLLHQLQQQPTK